MYKKNANMQSDVNGLGRAESLEISFIYETVMYIYMPLLIIT